MMVFVSQLAQPLVFLDCAFPSTARLVLCHVWYHHSHVCGEKEEKNDREELSLGSADGFQGECNIVMRTCGVAVARCCVESQQYRVNGPERKHTHKQKNRGQ
ncbi:hypothetical protein B0J18DRAFT_420086 [Chaetomium sp. MPI-SDFR-AT-0129]|nr:hypothetical protein B0J18DRAFT_420086 [Chaetomium sp. MPI-SDFR-AT-0129]